MALFPAPVLYQGIPIISSKNDELEASLDCSSNSQPMAKFIQYVTEFDPTLNLS